MKKITLFILLLVLAFTLFARPSGAEWERACNRWISVTGLSSNYLSSDQCADVLIDSNGHINAAYVDSIYVADGVAILDSVNISDGTATLDDLTVGAITSTGKLSSQTTLTAGASAGHIIKGTCAAAGSYSGTTAGLMVKAYDADNTVDHASGEYTGIYANVKLLSEMQGGGEASLMSLHEHSSSTGTFKYGIIQYSDATNAIGLSGGTNTNILNTINQTATNFISTADGKGGATVGTTDITSDLTADAYIRVKIGDSYYKMLLWNYSP